MAMDDLDRVRGWLADGTLTPPGSGADLVDFVRALAGRCGATDLPETAESLRLAEAIGAHEHLVFVLVDGLGSELLRELARGRGGFLSSLANEPLRAVFPSTTAVALTSLATGEHPARHGIPGWWTHLPERGVTCEILPFVERFSKRSLIDLGIGSETVLPLPSLMRRFDRDRVVVTRAYIAGSTYSRYWAGGAPSLGYERIRDGVDAVIGRVLSARQPSYTHLYLNQLDSLCHELGIGHPEVAKLFELIDHELERLRAALGGRARLLITADHGHIDAGAAREIAHDGEAMTLLRCPPSGEPRVPLFHVQPGQGERFREVFARDHGEAFALLTLDEAAGLGLLGPEPLSDHARAHFGDFLALSAGTQTLHYRDPRLKPHRHVGVHAGLSPAEMAVPLLLG
jgi:hypothetical protein